MYFLLADNDRPHRWLDGKPYIPGVKWWRGVVIQANIPNPIECKLKRHIATSPDHDQIMPAILGTNLHYGGTISLMQ